MDEVNEDGEGVEEGIRIFPWEVRERKGGMEALRVPSEVKLLEGGPATCNAYMEGKLPVFYDDGKMHLEEVREGEKKKGRDGSVGWC